MKLCPQCDNSQDLVVAVRHHIELDRFVVTCRGCGLETASFSTRELAIEAWNYRHHLRRKRDESEVKEQSGLVEQELKAIAAGLRGELAEAAATLETQGRVHNEQTCVLGSLCPWCKISRLRAAAAVKDEALRAALSWIPRYELDGRRHRKQIDTALAASPEVMASGCGTKETMMELREHTKRIREYCDYLDAHVLAVAGAWQIVQRTCEDLLPWGWARINEMIRLHDLSKVDASEFIAYQRRFYPVGESDKSGWDQAWFHHKRLNPHHWQNCFDWGEDCELHAVCMVCDWMAMGDALSYYEAHPDIRAALPAEAQELVFKILERVEAHHAKSE